MDQLNPSALGALLALYEHRTFCSSVLWGINAFDQWGVELGKEIGVQILQTLQSPEHSATTGGELDAGMRALIETWRGLNPSG
jgi:glucose-6-phosphate isomerase